MRLCLATAIHNLKWLNITHFFLIWDEAFTIFLITNNSDLIG